MPRQATAATPRADHTFSGHDASVALAKMKVDATMLNKSEEGLNEEELKTLADWIAKLYVPPAPPRTAPPTRPPSVC